LATTSDDKDDKSVKLWQVTNNALQKLESFSLGNTDKDAQPGYAVTFFPQSDLIAVGTTGGAVGLLGKLSRKFFIRSVVQSVSSQSLLMRLIKYY